MCNLPSGTVFSKEANVPMNNLSFLGDKTKDFLMKQSDFFNQSSFFWVGKTRPL